MELVNAEIAFFSPKFREYKVDLCSLSPPNMSAAVWCSPLLCYPSLLWGAAHQAVSPASYLSEGGGEGVLVLNLIEPDCFRLSLSSVDF